MIENTVASCLHTEYNHIEYNRSHVPSFASLLIPAAKARHLSAGLTSSKLEHTVDSTCQGTPGPELPLYCSVEYSIRSTGVLNTSSQGCAVYARCLAVLPLEGW
jgi:hypothetical protein